MAESVQTGGVMQFNYRNSEQIELDPERRSAIEDAYMDAEERERKEKKNKWIFWIIVVLIVLLFVGYFLLGK